jgi:hypothetical protein
MPSLFDDDNYIPPGAPLRRPAQRPRAPHPWPMLDNKACAECGGKPAPFGVGSILKAPEKMRFFCSLEHRDNHNG